MTTLDHALRELDRAVERLRGWLDNDDIGLPWSSELISGLLSREPFPLLTMFRALSETARLLGPNLTPSVQPVRSRDAVFLYRLQNGRIAERWAVRDDLTMPCQLGAITPPPPH